MAVAILLAVFIVLAVGIVAGLFVARSPKRRGAVPKASEPEQATVTPIDRPPKKKPRPSSGKSAEPSDDDVESLVREAEKILADARDTTPPPPAGTAEQGEQGDVLDDGTIDQLETELIAETTPSAEVRRRPSFRDRLGRARKAFGERLSDIRLRRHIDEEVWEDLEEALILADVGAELAAELIDDARRKSSDAKAQTAGDVVEALKNVLLERLEGKDRTLAANADGPTVWLVVGVNGTGKTTTIGKIANLRSEQGERVVLAAADTFRAAAADQLQIWADRSGSELVRGNEGADPGSIVFDAVSLTRSRSRDLLLVDTAGRLHTKVNLMEELKKIRRTAEKAGGQPNEVLLVLDATTGQNGLIQAREFTAAAGVTGVVLTKLDGTAKGGIAFAIEQEFGIPIKLVGLGEQAEDLVPFDPTEFIDALFM